MVKDGRGVSIRLVLLIGFVATVVSYLGLRIWTGQGHDLPQTSWGELVVLVFISCGVYFAGLPVRRFLRGQAKKSLNPVRAMRTLVLAQATALTGALVTGWYLAQVLSVFDVPSRRVAMVRLAALTAGGVLMSVAGLVTQAMCRLDGDPRDRDRDLDRDEEDDPSHEH
jgi:hypothetical protein